MTVGFKFELQLSSAQSSADL